MHTYIPSHRLCVNTVDCEGGVGGGGVSAQGWVSSVVCISLLALWGGEGGGGQHRDG